MKIAIAVLLVLGAALAAEVAMAADNESFKRDRRTLETAQMALESLRAALQTQNENLFEASAGVRNTASNAMVTSIKERASYLASQVEALANASSVQTAATMVNDAIDTANTAAVLAHALTDTLPPLRSRSEGALQSTLSLLRQFASHEKYIYSIETTYSKNEDAFFNATNDVDWARKDYLQRTNLTARSNTVLDDAQTLFDFIDNIDTTKLSTIESSMKLKALYSPSIPVFRWNVWQSYSQTFGWHAGNTAAYYGGVAPSTWDDGYGYAGSMSQDLDVLRTFFTHRMVSSWNANVWAQEWRYYSSTTAMHAAVLFRIRNTTPNNIDWSIYWKYFNYAGWSESSGITVNFQSNYQDNSNCYPCSRGWVATIPPMGISTIIVTTSSGVYAGNPYGIRSQFLGFYNNCLQLPQGLEYVDDLPVADYIYQRSA
eukprot:m.65819 g.65819  ORF g.65819 m.65819 type:complete len:430 (-) comp8170_c1_seq1:2278-3567(-)